MASERVHPMLAAGLALGLTGLAMAITRGPAQVAPPAAIRVTLLGTGNPRPTAERFGPSTLVEAGGQRLLFDVGRGTTMRLFSVDSARGLANVDAVFITHLHSDHLVGFAD